MAHARHRVAHAGAEVWVHGKDGLQWRNPDQRPRRAAIVGLVEARARLRASSDLALSPAHRGHAIHRRRGRHVHRLGVARLDEHRTDAARGSEVNQSGRHGRIEHQRVDSRPAVAAIRGSKQTRARGRIVAADWFRRCRRRSCWPCDRSDRSRVRQCCSYPGRGRSTATSDRPYSARHRFARRLRPRCRATDGSGPAARTGAKSRASKHGLRHCPPARRSCPQHRFGAKAGPHRFERIVTRAIRQAFEDPEPLRLRRANLGAADDSRIGLLIGPKVVIAER